MGLGRDPLKPPFLNPPPPRKTLGHRREIWLKSSGKVGRRNEWRTVRQVGVPFCCPLNYTVVGVRFHLVTFCLRVGGGGFQGAEDAISSFRQTVLHERNKSQTQVLRGTINLTYGDCTFFSGSYRLIKIVYWNTWPLFALALVISFSDVYVSQSNFKIGKI